MKNKKKKDKNKIIKRREFILNFLGYFGFFSIIAMMSIGAILEDKGYKLDADTFMPLILLYGVFIVWLMYYLSIKWGATKGGYYKGNHAPTGLSLNITPKMGDEELLMHFDKTKYEKKNIKIKGHNIIIYCNEVYSCINGYAVIKSNKNILEDIETIKKECSEVLIDYSENHDTISFNLMTIIYSNDKLDYKEYMKKLDMPDLYGFDELIIPGLVENNKLKYLNYIKGPMEQNYDLCIKELKKILKKKI